jgi:hypothetical protein
MNERDQTILVPAHIEHRQIAHEVGGSEVRLQRAEPLPEFPNPPLADCPHTLSSHIWNQRGKGLVVNRFWSFVRHRAATLQARAQTGLVLVGGFFCHGVARGIP